MKKPPPPAPPDDALDRSFFGIEAILRMFLHLDGPVDKSPGSMWARLGDVKAGLACIPSAQERSDTAKNLETFIWIAAEQLFNRGVEKQYDLAQSEQASLAVNARQAKDKKINLGNVIILRIASEQRQKASVPLRTPDRIAVKILDSVNAEFVENELKQIGLRTLKNRIQKLFESV